LKKIILSLLLFSSILFAEAKPYIGFSYGNIEENFTTTEETASTSSQFLNVKAGFGSREAYGVEIDLEYAQNKSKIFSSGTNEFDGDKYSLNVALVKAFDFNIYLLPYIKAGFGAGFMNIDRTMDTKLSFGSFNLGTGVLLPMGDNFDLEIGYKYRYVSYEGLNLITSKIIHKSHANAAFFGFNIRY